MTTIERPYDNTRFQAALIKSHLKLLSKGLKHSRMSGTQVLRAASAITNKPYKRGQYDAALYDIEVLFGRYERHKDHMSAVLRAEEMGWKLEGTEPTDNGQVSAFFSI